MKVVILQNILSSNNVVTINALIRKLKLAKGDVTVIFCSQTEANRHWTLREQPKFKYQVLPVKKIELKGNDLFTYFINPGVWHALNIIKPEKIIVGGWDQYSYQVAIIFAKLHHCQLVIWSGSTSYEKGWKRTLSKPLVKLFVKLSDEFIAYGTRSKEYLISLGAKADKILIHLNDVNAGYFSLQAKKLKPNRPKLLKKHQIKTTNNFLFVGQLIKRKGIIDLILAFALVAKNLPDFGLIIVGYGQMSEEIKIIINRLGLKKRVRLYPHVDQYDLPEYYAMSNILVLPSHEEVWGLVVNEAIHSKLKVIVSHVCGCVPDLIKKKVGLCYQAGNIKQLANSMKLLSKSLA